MAAMDLLRSVNQIVPPKGFSYSRVSLQKALRTLIVRRPIEQQVSIRKGFLIRLQRTVAGPEKINAYRRIPSAGNQR